jgi:hypothetical protein
VGSTRNSTPEKTPPRLSRLPPPPEGDGVFSSLPAAGLPSYPFPLSPPLAQVTGRSPGDAGGGGSSSPASWRTGRGLLLPWRRCTSGGPGPARPGESGGRCCSPTARPGYRELRWRLLHGLGTPAPDGLGRAQIGLSVLGSTAVGLLDGRGDELEGSQDGGSAASATHQGGQSFTGPFGPGQIRLGLVCSRCLVRSLTASLCGGAVEVGSSHVAARLLFLALTMSCASTIQAAVQCHKVTDDGDFKTVVAQASGWRS